MYYQIDSIRINSPENFIKSTLHIADGITTIDYELSNMISLEEFLTENKLTKSLFINILFAYCNCLKWCKEHFLYEYNLLSSIKFIYLNNNNDFAFNSNSLKFIYIPVSNYNEIDPLSNIINDMLNIINTQKECNRSPLEDSHYNSNLMLKI